MTQGPIFVICCPLCSGLAKYPTVASGNTFGAVYYTDGKRVAPMLPATPSVVRCAACRGVFWRSAAAEVGQFDEQREDAAAVDADWRKAGYLHEPDEAEHLAALDRLIASSPGEERGIRLLTWWRGNDRYRTPSPTPAPDNPKVASRRHANMRQLIALLDTAEPSDQLMRAEALRQLGEFDQAVAILSKPFPPEYDTALSRLLGLCAQRDTVLQKL
jgi:hypothetical protein